MKIHLLPHKFTINGWRLSPFVVSGLIWATGFTLIPEYMPYVFWAALFMVGAWLLVSAIQDKLKEIASHKHMNALQARYVELGRLIEAAEKNHAEVTPLRNERVRVLAEILRGV